MKANQTQESPHATAVKAILICKYHLLQWVRMLNAVKRNRAALKARGVVVAPLTAFQT